MRTFVRLRHVLAGHADLALRLDELENKYDAQFSEVFEAIEQLMQEPEPMPRQIGFRAKERQARYSTRKPSKAVANR